MKKLFWGALGALGVLAVLGTVKLASKKEKKRMRGVVCSIDREMRTFQVCAGTDNLTTVSFRVTPKTTFSWLAVLDSSENIASFDDLPENCEVLVVYCPCGQAEEPYAAQHVVLERVR